MASETKSYSGAPVWNMRKFIATTFSIVVGAMLFGSGWRMSTKKVQKIENERRIVSEALRNAELAIQGRETIVHQLEARRQIDLAQRALGERNYGVARQHVSEALARLATARKIGAVSAADSTAVEAILQGVTSPTDADSGKLSEAIKSLDAGLAKSVPAPDAVTPVTVAPPTANDAPDYSINKTQ